MRGECESPRQKVQGEEVGGYRRLASMYWQIYRRKVVAKWDLRRRGSLYASGSRGKRDSTVWAVESAGAQETERSENAYVSSQLDFRLGSACIEMA